MSIQGRLPGPLHCRGLMNLHEDKGGTLSKWPQTRTQEISRPLPQLRPGGLQLGLWFLLLMFIFQIYWNWSLVCAAAWAVHTFKAGCKPDKLPNPSPRIYTNKQTDPEAAAATLSCSSLCCCYGFMPLQSITGLHFPHPQPSFCSRNREGEDPVVDGSWWPINPAFLVIYLQNCTPLLKMSTGAWFS